MDGRLSDRDSAWLDEALEAHRQKNSKGDRQAFLPLLPHTRLSVRRNEMKIKLCYACAEKAKDVYRLDELTGPDKGKCDQCGQTRAVG